MGEMIDGYTLVAGNRVLLTAQTHARENGVWIVNAGAAPTRPTDANRYSQLVFAEVFVENRRSWRHSIWLCTLAMAPMDDNIPPAGANRGEDLLWLRRLSLDQNFLDRFVPYAGSNTNRMTGPLLLRNAESGEPSNENAPFVANEPFRSNEAVNREFVEDEIAEASSRAIDIDSLEEIDSIQDDDEFAMSVPAEIVIGRPTNLQSVTDFACLLYTSPSPRDS